MSNILDKFKESLDVSINANHFNENDKVYIDVTANPPIYNFVNEDEPLDFSEEDRAMLLDEFDYTIEPLVPDPKFNPYRDNKLIECQTEVRYLYNGEFVPINDLDNDGSTDMLTKLHNFRNAGDDNINMFNDFQFDIGGDFAGVIINKILSEGGNATDSDWLNGQNTVTVTSNGARGNMTRNIQVYGVEGPPIEDFEINVATQERLGNWNDETGQYDAKEEMSVYNSNSIIFWIMLKYDPESPVNKLMRYADISMTQEPDQFFAADGVGGVVRSPNELDVYNYYHRAITGQLPFASEDTRERGSLELNLPTGGGGRLNSVYQPRAIRQYYKVLNLFLPEPDAPRYCELIDAHTLQARNNPTNQIGVTNNISETVDGQTVEIRYPNSLSGVALQSYFNDRSITEQRQNYFDYFTSDESPNFETDHFNDDNEQIRLQYRNVFDRDPFSLRLVQPKALGGVSGTDTEGLDLVAEIFKQFPDRYQFIMGPGGDELGGTSWTYPVSSAVNINNGANVSNDAEFMYAYAQQYYLAPYGVVQNEDFPTQVPDEDNDEKYPKLEEEYDWVYSRIIADLFAYPEDFGQAFEYYGDDISTDRWAPGSSDIADVFGLSGPTSSAPDPDEDPSPNFASARQMSDITGRSRFYFSNKIPNWDFDSYPVNVLSRFNPDQFHGNNNLDMFGLALSNFNEGYLLYGPGFQEYTEPVFFHNPKLPLNPGRRGQLTDTQNYIFGLSSTRDVNAYTEQLRPASSNVGGVSMNNKLFNVFKSVADRNKTFVGVGSYSDDVDTLYDVGKDLGPHAQRPMYNDELNTLNIIPDSVGFFYTNQQDEIGDPRILKYDDPAIVRYYYETINDAYNALWRHFVEVNIKRFKRNGGLEVKASVGGQLIFNQPNDVDGFRKFTYMDPNQYLNFNVATEERIEIPNYNYQLQGKLDIQIRPNVSYRSLVANQYMFWDRQDLGLQPIIKEASFLIDTNQIDNTQLTFLDNSPLLRINNKTVELTNNLFGGGYQLKVISDLDKENSSDPTNKFYKRMTKNLLHDMVSHGFCPSAIEFPTNMSLLYNVPDPGLNEDSTNTNIRRKIGAGIGRSMVMRAQYNHIDNRSDGINYYDDNEFSNFNEVNRNRSLTDQPMLADPNTMYPFGSSELLMNKKYRIDEKYKRQVDSTNEPTKHRPRYYKLYNNEKITNSGQQYHVVLFNTDFEPVQGETYTFNFKYRLSRGWKVTAGFRKKNVFQDSYFGTLFFNGTQGDKNFGSRGAYEYHPLTCHIPTEISHYGSTDNQNAEYYQDYIEPGLRSKESNPSVENDIFYSDYILNQNVSINNGTPNLTFNSAPRHIRTMVRDQEFFRIQDNFSDAWTSVENPFRLFHTSTWAQDNDLAWDVYTTTVESIKDLTMIGKTQGTGSLGDDNRLDPHSMYCTYTHNDQVVVNDVGGFNFKPAQSDTPVYEAGGLQIVMLLEKIDYDQPNPVSQDNSVEFEIIQPKLAEPDEFRQDPTSDTFGPTRDRYGKTVFTDQDGRNPNFGGYLPTDENLQADYELNYRIRVRKDDYNAPELTQYRSGVFGTYAQSIGLGVQPLSTYTKNGYELVFEENGTYYFDINVNDSYNNNYRLIQPFDVTDIVKPTPSVSGYYSPYQGINIDLSTQEWLEESVNVNGFIFGLNNPGRYSNALLSVSSELSEEQSNSLYWEDIADLDKRPNLGVYVYEEDQPVNIVDNLDGALLGLEELDVSGSIIDGGWLVNAWDNGSNVSGIWQELGGDPNSFPIGEYDEGENRWERKDINIDYKTNWIPEIDIRPVENLNNQLVDASLVKYYDRNIDPQIVEFTTAPTTVNFFIYKQPTYTENTEQINVNGVTNAYYIKYPEYNLFYRKGSVGDEIGAELIQPFQDDIGIETYVTNIDFGDGTQNDQLQFRDKPKKLGPTSMITHTYTEPGIYEVTGTMFDVIVLDGAVLGHTKFYTFRARFNLNAGLNKEEKFIINKKPTVVVGGISEDSVYAKSLRTINGWNPDGPPTPINLTLQYDRLMSFYSAASVSEKYYEEEYLAQWMVPIQSGSMEYENVFDINTSYPRPTGNITNERVINYGLFNEVNNLGNYIGDSDIGQVRVSNKPIRIYEHLGFGKNNIEGALSASATPTDFYYWKNIIPEDTNIYTDREGVDATFDTQLNSISLEGIDVESNQNWHGNFAYPILPKFNEKLQFTESFPQPLQTSVENEIVFYGGKDGWNIQDNKSKITNLYANDKFTVMDVDLQEIEEDTLYDTSGNDLSIKIAGDYKININVEEGSLSRTTLYNKPTVGREEKQF